ncbi:hypothetical protein JCM5353_000535 [Sporobolomyces roseus]
MSAYSLPRSNQQRLTPLPPHAPIPTFPLFNLSHLVIHGPESHLLDWKIFLARCTCLTTLEIFGEDDLSIYTSLLEAVPVPTSITPLSLWIEGFPDDSNPHTLSAIHVSLLPNLKKLVFRGEGEYSQTLLNARQNSQLEALTIDFKHGASVNSEDLLDFLSSLPSDHSLHHLDCDVWIGKRVKQAAEVDIEEIMSEELSRIAVDWAESHALGGWRVTEFPDCLHGGGFSRIKDRAIRKGVEIGGSVVTALAVEEEYRQESAEFRRMWNEWREANPR